MITKIYELTRMSSAFFRTKYCGVTMDLSFTDGRGSGGKERAELVVTDRFKQDAIEHDPRFGRDFFLAATYGEEEDSEVEKLMKAEAASKAEEPAKADKKKGKKKAEVNEESTIEAVTEVASVVTLNDAYDVFAEMGIAVENAEQLEELCKSMNIVFPNLKV